MNYGFRGVQVLDGNFGYIDLRMFHPAESGLRRADAAMTLLSETDAIIIDLRHNNGGNVAMVEHLSSYFFDQPTLLLTQYRRVEDQLIDSVTHALAKGRANPTIPLYLLTSRETISAGEAFIFGLTTHDRATIVGEATAGGGHFGGPRPISNDYEVWMPVGRAYNKDTGVGWEADGIQPHFQVPAEEALAKAIEIATPASQAYRTAKDERLAAIEAKFVEKYQWYRDNALAGSFDGDRDAVFAFLQEGVDHDVVGESFAINVAYYLIKEGEDVESAIDLAICFFEFAVHAWPDSSNAHDSLAEGYMGQGRDELAIRHYQISMELNPGNAEHAESQIKEIKSRS